MIFSFVFSGLAHAWPWSRDMADQPSIEPYEGPENPPENTLPVTGERLPMTREEMGEKLKNPIQPTKESIENGKRLYMINCSLCHGKEGKGDGSVSKKFVPPPDLTLDFFKKRPDGYIYGTITNGGAVMPAYAENISEKERWDVVNFIRFLQGK